MGYPEYDPHMSIREMLDLLGSEQEQLAYEKGVSWVDITNELVCMWFDDSYHPDDARFRQAFTAAELEALASFDSFYEARWRALPTRPGTVRTWLADSTWREIMQKAREALALLRP